MPWIGLGELCRNAVHFRLRFGERHTRLQPSDNPYETVTPVEIRNQRHPGLIPRPGILKARRHHADHCVDFGIGVGAEPDLCTQDFWICPKAPRPERMAQQQYVVPAWLLFFRTKTTAKNGLSAHQEK